MDVGNKIIISYKNIKIVSFIEKILEDNKVLIQAPYLYKDEILFDKNEEYNLIILTKSDIIKSLANIKDSVLTNRRKYYIVEIKQSYKKNNQKRKYERFFCNLPYKIYLLNEYQEEEINIIIKDISLGGIRFLTNTDISKQIYLKIPIDEDYFLASGEIIQVQYYPKANYKSQYRIKFYDTQNGYLLKNYFTNIKTNN